MKYTCIWTVTTVELCNFKCIRGYPSLCIVTVAERLRRWIRNPMGFPRTGSNPVRDDYHFCLLKIVLHKKKKKERKNSIVHYAGEDFCMFLYWTPIFDSIVLYIYLAAALSADVRFILSNSLLYYSYIIRVTWVLYHVKLFIMKSRQNHFFSR